MTENVIVSAEQVTPEWLTSVFKERGVLPSGEVTSIKPNRQQSTFASCVLHLDVIYSEEVLPITPRRLFLKISNPALAPGELDLEHIQKEFIFYRLLAPAMNGALTIPCYHAAYDPETGASHILLRDVSETHVTCSTPSCELNCERAVDSLARLHAYWWDHPRLGKEIGNFPTKDERQREWLEAETSTVAFMNALGDQLHRSWQMIYESVLPALPHLYQRHAQGRNLTLVHGDAHLGNFLFPGDTGVDNTYMVDWQFWHPTIGGTDLAFLMATEWESETRRDLEVRLMRRYYKLLIEHGVCDYQWDDCWNDYRLSVILVSIFIPVWRWSVFKWDADLIALERSMQAFDDLQCHELL